MSVTKHGETLGVQLIHERHGSLDVMNRLIWQAIHEINIDLVYISLTQSIDGPLNNKKWLNAPDRILHVRRKVLNTETCACHANISKDGCDFFCYVTRIKLKCMLAQRRKVETNVKLRDQVAQPLGPEN